MTTQESDANPADYPVSLSIDYPTQSSRTKALFRLFLVIPIGFLWFVLTCSGSYKSLFLSLFIATGLMILFRRKYPKWWFDFLLEATRFSFRVFAYLLLLTDRYPSVDEQQDIHIDIKYPDASQLSRWAPLYKWFLSIPHFICLMLLAVPVALATIYAWFHILVAGCYPRPTFGFIVGVLRWGIRVNAYAIKLVTDQYPPFSMK